MPTDFGSLMRKPEKIEGTVEQKLIWEEIKNGEQNLAIEARAGTGKTFTLIQGLRGVAGKVSKGLKVGMTTFTKAGADDIKSRSPGGVWIGTLNSLGFLIIRQNVENVEFEIDKTWDIISDLKEDYGIRQWKKGERPAIRQLVNQLKQVGFDPRKGADTKLFEDLCLKFDIRWPGPITTLYAYALDVLQFCLRRTNIVDYSDQLWLPYVLEMEGERFDMLMVDESQDLNGVQHALAMRIGDRILIVGDTFQSMYGFRGADTESMGNFKELLEKTDRGLKTLSLTTCWRCPGRVIALAKQIVPDIEKREEAPDGIVRTISSDEAYGMWEAGDMVLCRTNAPLINAVYRLWRDKRRAYIQGRDIGDSLKRMIERFKDDSTEETLPALNAWIDRYELREREKLEKRKGSTSQRMALEDRCDCIRVMVDYAGDLRELEAQMKFIFVDKGNPKTQIRLSSIHRAKGLEANRVFLLEPKLIPHFMARQEWEMEQERNIGYVAVTRAKEEFYFVGGLSPLFGGTVRPSTSKPLVFPRDEARDMLEQLEIEEVERIEDGRGE